MDTALNFYILTFFDLTLITALLWLAYQSLSTDNIFKAVILFVSFGLLMALAWVRLHAPDVALAEAALGAGLTGPLFLAAYRRMEKLQKKERRLERNDEQENDEQS